MVTTLETAEVAAHRGFVVARTARRLRQEAFAAEGRGELSLSLSAALATIDVHGPVTPSELAERERVKRPTATRILTNLARLGLVTRTPDPVTAAFHWWRRPPRAVRRCGACARARTRTAKRLRGLDPDEVETLERAATIPERLLDEERSDG